MRLLAMFLLIAGIVGWIAAIDSEARYQCAKEANDILAIFAFAPGLPAEHTEQDGDLIIRFNGDPELTFTYSASCRKLNKAT